MKKIVIISSSVGVVCLALIGLAIAAGHVSGGWHHSPEEKVAYVTTKISETLELDAAQKAVLDRIADDIIAEHQQISSDRQAFKADLLTTLDKERVSPEELKALFETKKPAIEEMMQSASEYIAEFHSILTAQQRATLIAEIESHEGRRCRFMR